MREEINCLDNFDREGENQSETSEQSINQSIKINHPYTGSLTGRAVEEIHTE